jgi:hypothetical protein
MANVPQATVLATILGATRIERAMDRDVWRVVGGWGDGIEITSEEMYEARASATAFVALMRSKIDAQTAKMMQGPPRWFPGSDVPPPRMTKIAGSLAEASRDEILDAIRYSGPSMEPGSVIRYVPNPLEGRQWPVPLMSNDERAKMSLDRYKRDNAPKKKSIEEVVLKPRKYGKDK